MIYMKTFRQATKHTLGGLSMVFTSVKEYSDNFIVQHSNSLVNIVH